MEIKRTQKINWVLILQGWAMLWVVIGHAGPENDLDMYPRYAKFIYDTAYSFHMPLFIFISGFLFYLTRINNERWRFLPMLVEKLKRFGIPFVFFTIIGIIVKHIFSASVERPTELSFYEFFNAIIYPNEGPMREFWFLATIMWYFALLPVWRLIIKRRVPAIFAIAVSISLHFFHPETKLLAIDSFCYYLVYFILGIIAGLNNRKFVLQGHWTRFCIPVSLVIYILSRSFGIELFAAVSGISLSVGLALVLDRFTPLIFSSFRNYTYQIFLMSIFVQVFVKLLRVWFELPFFPMYVLSTIAGLYIPVAISKLIIKTKYLPLMMCFGLK